MKVIQEVNHQHLGLTKTGEDIKYEVRKAARAVLINGNRQVALLHVVKDGYYKLPGGGIEGDETIQEALKREVLEEVGADIEITHDIGMILEYRDLFEQLQISYSFLGKTNGELKGPNYTVNELAHGFQLVWLPMSEAIQTIQSYEGDKYVARFICYRDLLIIKEAARIMGIDFNKENTHQMVSKERIILRNIELKDLEDYYYWNLPTRQYHAFNGPYFGKTTETELQAYIE